MSRSLVGSRGASRSPSPQGPARKISAPAYYASPSYISIENSKTRKSSFRKYGAQKESMPDRPSYDPSLLFARCPDKSRWVGPFTKPPLFPRNRLIGRGNPTFESYVEGKALVLDCCC